jgi:hypothetical protein
VAPLLAFFFMANCPGSLASRTLATHGSGWDLPCEMYVKVDFLLLLLEAVAGK